MNENGYPKRSILFTIIIAISFYFLLLNVSVVTNTMAYLFSVIFPFLFGAAIAFILNIPMKTFEKKLKMKRIFAFLLTLLCFIAIIFLVLFIVIPELISTGNTLVEQIPKAFESIQSLI